MVFSARDPVEAHLLRAVLGSEGIEATVQGEFLFLVRGGVPFDNHTTPSVWVDDDDADRARTIVEGFVRRRDLTIEPD
ncbi:MAG TPA: DUF2007 domain-containing protein [Gemmatimonadales bacterium]|jgi:hypothetical protein|nr:DUF2007 domain-containing protein [Gemmatimonadales bacterium]